MRSIAIMSPSITLLFRAIVTLLLSIPPVRYVHLTSFELDQTQTHPHTNLQTSRLIFNMTQRESADYFTVSLSPSGDKMTIVDGPTSILPSLDAGIRAVFPRKIASNRYTEDGVYKIEVKKSFGSTYCVFTMICRH